MRNVYLDGSDVGGFLALDCLQLLDSDVPVHEACIGEVR